MPSKSLKLHGEAKSECFTIGCVPDSVVNYLQYFDSDFLRFDMLQIKYNSQTLACKQKQMCGWLGPCNVKYIALPVSQHFMSFCEKEKQKKNAITKYQYLKTWKIRFLQGFDKHFHCECARSKPLLHIFKKIFQRFAARRHQADVFYANGGIGFCKYDAKNLWTITFALRSQGWNMADRVARKKAVFVTSQISTGLWRSRQLVSNPVVLWSMVPLVSHREERARNLCLAG